MVAEFPRRRDLVVDGLNALPGVSCLSPRGAFYVFPNISGMPVSAEELADRLLEEAGVAVLAGTAFGSAGRRHLRLSYANSQANLTRALERMDAFLGTRCSCSCSWIEPRALRRLATGHRAETGGAPAHPWGSHAVIPLWRGRTDVRRSERAMACDTEARPALGDRLTVARSPHQRPGWTFGRWVGRSSSRAGGPTPARLRIRPAVHGRRRGGAVPRRPGHRRPDQRVGGRPGARRAGRGDGRARAPRLPARAHHRRRRERRRGRRARRGAAARGGGDRRGAARLRHAPDGRRGRRRDHRQGALRRIRDLLGDAVATPVGGLHIHVGMPDPTRRSAPSTGCAGTCRCCRRWLPTRRSATAATRAWPRRAR